ncbi:hypothetical protein B0H67DRAFT_559296 [Lasiosphaeris hirsuta]|uniref:Uncharacterized protein n=1 Tax=Lasiosphaeris hirsuta TaxID=260670 RepID=A0AA40E945_9PEZI|nr:hypothetical protein B0H67DRAFT_559296 [Lasiosphaeris hirsuta]
MVRHVQVQTDGIEGWLEVGTIIHRSIDSGEALQGNTDGLKMCPPKGCISTAARGDTLISRAQCRGGGGGPRGGLARVSGCRHSKPGHSRPERAQGIQSTVVFAASPAWDGVEHGSQLSWEIYFLRWVEATSRAGLTGPKVTCLSIVGWINSSDLAPHGAQQQCGRTRLDVVLCEVSFLQTAQNGERITTKSQALRRCYH